MPVATGELTIVDVLDGAPGPTGPRSATSLVYYQLTSPSAPATPDATSFNFATGAFTGLTANWATSPPTFVAGNTNKYWYSYYFISEATYEGAQTLSFGTPLQGIGFSGLVTFQGDAHTVGDGTNTLSFGASGTTTINGGNITTGNLTAALNVTTGSLQVSDSGKIYSGKTTYATAAAGWFLGLDAGVPKFKIGNAADTASLTWDGTTLTVKGAIVQDSGITPSVVTVTGTNTPPALTASATITRVADVLTTIQVVVFIDNAGGSRAQSTPFPFDIRLRRGGAGGTILNDWIGLPGTLFTSGGGVIDDVVTGYATVTFIDTDTGSGSTEYHATLTPATTFYSETVTVTATQTSFS